MARRWAFLRVVFGRGELTPERNRKETMIQRLLEALQTFWRKALVVLKAAPTWLTLTAVILNILAEEIGGVLPAGSAELFGEWVIRIGAWLGAAVHLIRRLTPVLPDERGILPKDLRLPEHLRR